MKDGRLPDLKGWSRAFRAAVGEAFVFRGCEATVEGWLVEVAGQPALCTGGGTTVLRLAALERKVQWDVAARREQAATAAERGAHARLAATWDGRPRRVRLVGPLSQADDGRFTLHVREFAEAPARRRATGRP
jgi:hypothetical protein